MEQGVQNQSNTAESLLESGSPREETDQILRHSFSQGERNSSPFAISLIQNENTAEEGSNLCTPLKYFTNSRILDVLFLIILNLVIMYSMKTQFEQYIPQSMNPQGQIIANNTAFSYPVTLNDIVCLPSVLEQCLSEETDGNPCCIAMSDGYDPSMQVSVKDLFLISIMVPLVFLFLRSFWIRCFGIYPNTKDNQTTSDIRKKRNILMWYGLRDNLVGYFFTMVTNGAITTVIKKTVGRPRPNNFALGIFSVYTSHDMVAQSFQSFPSGHASMSMCSMFYLSLVMLHDINETQDRGCWNNPSCSVYIRAIYVLRAMLPIFLSLYVGCTRIIDYWHHPSDVLTGWSLGILCAFIGYYHVRSSRGLLGVYVEVMKGKTY